MLQHINALNMYYFYLLSFQVFDYQSFLFPDGKKKIKISCQVKFE